MTQTDDGLIINNGKEGVTVSDLSTEALLAVVIDRLRSIQSSASASPSYGIVLTKVEDAFEYLIHRSVIGNRVVFRAKNGTLME